MIRREGIMVEFFSNRRGRSVTWQQPILRGQFEDLGPDRSHMGLIERTGIRPANGSRKQCIADETDALGLGIHSIANPAGGVARRSQTVYAQAPDRDRLTIFRLLQLCTGWPPAEEIDILRSEIHRRLTKLQNLVNPVGM